MGILTETDKEEITKNTLMLLGLTSSNGIVDFLIDDTVNLVSAYCHIDVIPYQLYGFVSQYAAAKYKNQNYGTPEAVKDVTSMSQGDRSVSYKLRDDSILGTYKQILKPWISKEVFVPSDK